MENYSSVHGPRVYDNILQVIGNTPLVRLNRIPKDYGLECEILVKCEFLNPGGSVKDRIAYAMVKDAEKKGLAKTGTRFVEPSSGNTGIGVCLVAAVCGYHCTIVSPDKNSNEKMYTSSLLGAEVVRTLSLVSEDSPEFNTTVVKNITENDPNAMTLNQYKNEVNPRTHYEHTAEEILSAVGELDMIVMGVGTGGSITGISRKFKEKCPKCVVVGVDPIGSVIFGEDEPYKLFFLEGIGNIFVPKVLDKKHIQKVVRPKDCQSFNMSRELARKEGLLCGGSSGAAVFSAIKTAKDLNLGKGKRVVVILPDGIRNYMTKFVCDQWMEARLFKEVPQRDYVWWNRSISNLSINRSIPLLKGSTPCCTAVAAMGSEHDVAIVTDNAGFFKGVISKNSLRSKATNPRRKGLMLNFSDPVDDHLINESNHYQIVENQGHPTVGLASRILDIAPFVVIVEEFNHHNVNGFIPKGIVTADIVLDYIIEHQHTQYPGN